MDTGELKSVRTAVLRAIAMIGAMLLMAGRQSGITIPGRACCHTLQSAEQERDHQQHDDDRWGAPDSHVNFSHVNLRRS